MLILLASIAFLVILLLLSLNIAFSFFSYLSKPKDLQVAKNKGENLLGLRNSTVMMVGAHPDDADWYVGGTLSVLHEKGNKVVVVVATSGEKGGNAGNLGRIRENEQLKAAKILGYDKVEFLRFPDGNLKASEQLVGKIKNLIDEYEPSVVFTFDSVKEGYIYRHPDHKASGEATLEALRGKSGVETYLFHSSSNDVIVDITSAQDSKIKALTAHKSQGVGGSSRYRRLFFFTGRRPAGSALDFSSVGIRYGEMFRKL